MDRGEGARSGAAHRVLNNNVVVTTDASGRERVLMGRGLGFDLKHSDAVDPAKVEKTFILDEGPEGERERTVLAQTPYPVVEAVNTAVDRAERRLERQLGRRFTIAVIDHVQYVLERLEQGLRIPAGSMPELRVLYANEFAAAEQMAESIARDLECELPPEEAVFLTMHVLNATRDEQNGTAALFLRRLQHVVDIVEREIGVDLDRESPDYARFILHVQFLLQRLVSRTMLAGQDTSFFMFARNRYTRAFEIAESVKEYVLAATGSELTDEEVLYLIVHVERLRSQLTFGNGDSTVLR